MEDLKKFLSELKNKHQSISKFLAGLFIVAAVFMVASVWAVNQEGKSNVNLANVDSGDGEAGPFDGTDMQNPIDPTNEHIAKVSADEQSFKDFLNDHQTRASIDRDTANGTHDQSLSDFLNDHQTRASIDRGTKDGTHLSNSSREILDFINDHQTRASIDRNTEDGTHQSDSSREVLDFIDDHSAQASVDRNTMEGTHDVAYSKWFEAPINMDNLVPEPESSGSGSGGINASENLTAGDTDTTRSSSSILDNIFDFFGNLF